MPWPRFTWDVTARQYRDSRGRFVPRAAVREALDATIDRAAADIEAVARRLQAGEVEIGGWQGETERLLKTIHVASGAAAVGGWGQATPETWGLVGARLREQYAYLRDFAGQLANGLPLDGRFLARAGMYALSGTATYEAVLRRGDLAAGYDLERRILHPGKSEACPECVGYAALGWQPADTLPDIGQGSRCLTRCRCRFTRRRSGTRLPRVSPITGAIVTAFAAPEVDFAETGLVAGPEVEFGDFEPVQPEPEPYRPPWWRRVVAFATRGRLPRKAHASLNPDCGTGAGGFKHGNTCGKRTGAHGTGRGGTQAQRKKLAAKIRALRGQAKTPEQKRQLLAAIRTLKAHERGTGDSAAAAKIRRQIHAGKAPKVAVAPKPPAVPKPTVKEQVAKRIAARKGHADRLSEVRSKVTRGKSVLNRRFEALPKVKEYRALERERDTLVQSSRKKRADHKRIEEIDRRLESLRQEIDASPGVKELRRRGEILAARAEKVQQANVRQINRELQAKRGQKIQAAVAARRAQRGLSAEQRQQIATGLKQGRKVLGKDLRDELRKSALGQRRQALGVGRKLKPTAAERVQAAVATRRQQRGLSGQQRATQAARLKAARTKPAPVAKAKGFTGPIDPGKPIAQRIKSYASGPGEARRQAVLAAAKPHLDRRDAIERELYDPARTFEVVKLQNQHDDAARDARDFSERSKQGKEARAKLAEIGPKLDALKQHRDGLRAERDAIQEKVRQATAEALKVEDPVKITWKHGDIPHGRDGSLSPLDATTRGHADEAASWLAGITRKGDGPHLADLPIGQQIHQRPYARTSGSNPHIAVKPGESTDLIVHEIGHHLEARLSIGGTKLIDHVNEFLKHRVGSETPVKLKDKFKGKYRDDEVGRKDQFDRAFTEEEAYYIGKDYGGRSTEVVSMGVQKLYNDPVGFAQKDPEYFHFITGVLSGHLR